MRRKERLPELLVPAGSPEALRAGLLAGADAVYFGGRSFGARAYARNFDYDEIRAAVELCHRGGARAYVTVNTLVYDRELAEVTEHIARLYEAGADALIVADTGLIALCRRLFPTLPIHGSTQCSAHSTASIDALAALGCERVVPARELSKENIKYAVEHSTAEIEVFLHGALCVCHSGQCLFSSVMGSGRSGNRGSCAQPCRLGYNGGYPLSLRDLCLAEHITELIDSGVASLKIEGRMKSPEYVYHTARIYRRLLDEGRNATPDELRELRNIFSRDGFTDGYFTDSIASPMTGVRSDENKEATYTLAPVPDGEITEHIKAKCIIKPNTPLSLTLTGRLGQVTVAGDIPQPAQRQPMTEESVRDRLMRLGGTGYRMEAEDIDLTLEGELFLPASALNGLRRAAVEALTALDRRAPAKYALPEPMARGAAGQLPGRVGYFHFPDRYEALGEKERGFFDAVCFPLEKSLDCAAVPDCVALPPVITDSETEEISVMLRAARDRGVTHAAVGNIGHIAFAVAAGLIPVGTHRLNVSNCHSRDVYRSLGIEDMTLSLELSPARCRDIGGRVPVYGRLPLMLTERCFVRENGGCERCDSFTLKDRTGEHFPIVRCYPHRNVILNSRPTYMLDKPGELRGIGERLYLFTTETVSDIRGVLHCAEGGLTPDYPIKRMYK